MGIINFAPRRVDGKELEAGDRFDARLDALSRNGRRPMPKRESLFEHFKSQAIRQEA